MPDIDQLFRDMEHAGSRLAELAVTLTARQMAMESVLIKRLGINESEWITAVAEARSRVASPGFAGSDPSRLASLLSDLDQSLHVPKAESKDS